MAGCKPASFRLLSAMNTLFQADAAEVSAGKKKKKAAAAWVSDTAAQHVTQVPMTQRFQTTSSSTSIQGSQ